MTDTLFASSLLTKEKSIQEPDLVIPMLLVLAQADRGGLTAVSTFQMHHALLSAFEMSEEDKQIVRRDSVTRFQRTLQNVISHELLTKDGLAKKTEKGLAITPRGRAFLLDRLLEPNVASIDHAEMRVLTDGERVLENAIAFRMLVRLAELQIDNKKPISTAQLRKDLKSSFPLSVHDIAPLKNRTDTKIDQIARNVVSHNTLTKNGWATRSEKGFVITTKGKAHALNVLLEAWPTPDFSFLIKAENEFRSQVNERRAEVATDAAAARKARQRP